jgi:ferrous iron transport protein B
MFSLYVLGIVAAMGAAWVFKKTLFKGPPPPLMMELPPYKIPAWRNILVTMVGSRVDVSQACWNRIFWLFQSSLWFLLSYPKLGVSQQAEAVRDVVPAQGIDPGPRGVPQVLDDTKTSATANEEAQAAAQLRHSFAGRLGRVIEPVIAPLGFNWKVGIGLIGAMSAREVFVSTMGTVYPSARPMRHRKV